MGFLTGGRSSTSTDRYWRSADHQILSKTAHCLKPFGIGTCRSGPATRNCQISTGQTVSR